MLCMICWISVCESSAVVCRKPSDANSIYACIYERYEEVEAPEADENRSVVNWCTETDEADWKGIEELQQAAMQEGKMKIMNEVVLDELNPFDGYGSVKTGVIGVGEEIQIFHRVLIQGSSGILAGKHLSWTKQIFVRSRKCVSYKPTNK